VTGTEYAGVEEVEAGASRTPTFPVFCGGTAPAPQPATSRPAAKTHASFLFTETP
jgi:hypothetical protein